MELLLSIHHHLDPNAGAPGATINMGQSYTKMGHRVEFLSFDDLPKGLKDVAQCLAFPPFVARKLTRLMKQRPLDIIEASSGDAWIWSKFFRHKLPRPPLVVAQSHGLEHIMHLQILEEAKQGNLQLSWKYPLYHGGYRLWEVAESFRQADVVCLLNQADADYTINHLGVEAQKVHIFPNGIPNYFLDRPFRPLPHQSQQPICIAHIGTYISRKGIRYGMPALNAILARHPHVTVKIIGTGCPVATVLADLDPQVHAQVQVIPHYAHHNLPEILQACQILLFPSLSEGFPLAIPEAMACGLAPIITNIPGSTEIVMNEVNGLVVPVRHSEALIHAMDRLILHPNYLNQLRRAAYNLAQNYAWQRVAQQRLDLYESVLSRQASRKTYILV